MILLLNTTKTMNMKVPVPSRLKVTEPCHLKQARILADKVSMMSLSQLTRLMSLSEKLAIKTRDNAVLWGREDRSKIPALFGFTGLVYKNIDSVSLDAAQLNYARKKVRILSGLYGLLRPFDLIEVYRLEMGHKLAVGKVKNIVEFWKETLTAGLNEDLKVGEPVISLAAKEYIKALDVKKLKGPVISPVFKEVRANGTYRTVAVHSKKARGRLIRYALENNAQNPRDLMGFNAMGWNPAQKAPEAGPWLFTRPVSP